MYARTALIARPVLFKQIEFDITESTSSEVKSILLTVNEFIGFINNFRFRTMTSFDEDVEQREKLVMLLKNKDQHELIRKRLFVHWCKKELPLEKISEKELLLQALFQSFSLYASFSHLTATELAVITIAVQKLIVFLQCSQRQIKEVMAQECIRFKLNELIDSQAAIYACMTKHLEVFNQKVNAESNPDGLPENDILLAILSDINQLAGTSAADWFSIQPDTSLLFAIPDLPFGNDQDARTAKYFFESCCSAYLQSQQWSAKAGAAIEKAGEWTGWCLQSAWWVTSSIVTAPIKLVGGGVRLASSAVKGANKPVSQVLR